MLHKYDRVLRNRDFGVAVFGRTFSMFGDEMAMVTLTLRLQASGAHPYDVAILMSGGLLPFVALSRVAGNLADRLDSRRLLLASSIAAAVVSVPLIVVHQIVGIVILVTLLGVCAAFSQATWSALTPRIVGEAQIGPAIGFMQGAFSVATLLAPAVGGILTGLFGTGMPLAVDAVSFAVLAGATLLVKTRRRPVPSTRQADERGGFVWIRQDPLLRVLIASLAIFILLASMANIVLVFLVRGLLHAGPAWFGVTEAVWGLGVVTGALLTGAAWVNARKASLAMIGAGAIGVALVGYAAAPAVVLLLPAGLVGGLGNGLLNAGASALVLERTAERVRGRVGAAVSGITNGAAILSLAAGGAVSALLGPRSILGIAGVLGLFAALVGGTLVRRASSAAAGMVVGSINGGRQQ